MAPQKALPTEGRGCVPLVNVLQSCIMSNTLTIRLPEEMLEWLKKTSRRTGIPVGRLVRQSLETTLSKEGSGPLLEFAGLVKGGPRNVSSRKGFSRD